ncbi:hypothetical protein [Paenibacillus gansuensis]|uniref:MarR family transcriptional regulator n=1 Tax=Paenibacillus gansuensis TaxID=306542 RepID=A0ABW5PBT8_9BACL
MNLKYDYRSLSTAERQIYDLLTTFRIDTENYEELTKRSGFSEFHVKAAVQLLKLKGLLK